MGKKSKRNKPKRQARRQQRQEQEIQQQAPGNNSDDEEDGEENEEKDNRLNTLEKDSLNLQFFVGDWVWYRDKLLDTMEGPCYHRGIVVQSDERRWKRETCNDPPRVTVVPWDADPNDPQKYVKMHVRPPPDKTPDRWDVLLDKWPLTLRFKVGDQVLCSALGGWAPATVQHIYNIWTDAGCVYLCAKEIYIAGPDAEEFIVVPQDDDDCIIERPQSFRFAKGDRVLFSSTLAVGLDSGEKYPTWKKGIVKNVDVIRGGFYLGCYEICFGIGKTCFVWRDDDRHIASAESKAVDRFIDSIHQSLDYNHFDYLAPLQKLDVQPIINKILDLSIQQACYGSLLWLHENAPSKVPTDLWSRLARSSVAERLLRSLRSGKEDENDKPNLLLSFDTAENHGNNKTSPAELFLKTLIMDRNDRLLALVACPIQGLAWDRFSVLTEEQLVTLRDSCRGGKFHSTANLLHYMLRFYHSRNIACTLSIGREYRLSHSKQIEVAATALDDKLLCSTILGASSPVAAAEIVIRFCCQFSGTHPAFQPDYETWVPFYLVEHGFVASLRHFVRAHPSILQHARMADQTARHCRPKCFVAWVECASRMRHLWKSRDSNMVH